MPATPATATTTPMGPKEACAEALREPYLRWLLGADRYDFAEFAAFGDPPPEIQSELMNRRDFWWSTMHSLHRIVTAFSDEDGNAWSDEARRDARLLADDHADDLCSGGLAGPPDPTAARVVQAWVAGVAPGPRTTPSVSVLEPAATDRAALVEDPVSDCDVYPHFCTSGAGGLPNDQFRWCAAYYNGSFAFDADGQCDGSDPASSCGQLGVSVFREGDGWCPEITQIQYLLSRVTMYSTEISGYFDQGTREAIVKYQGPRGLQDDGMFGPDTWSALLAEYDSTL